MRRPTPLLDLYDWHTASLRGGRVAVIEGEPECGFFKMRMIKGGPWVPVMIWCLQVVDENGDLAEPERLLCEVGDEMRDPAKVWTHCAGRPISEDEHHDLRTRRDDEIMRATHAQVDLTEKAIRP